MHSTPTPLAIRIADLLDRFMPEAARQDPEVRRRAQLFVSFSALGAVFGALFGGFYLCIGHPWGALIVFLCTCTLAVAPWIVKSQGLEMAGNIYALVLVMGFTGLTVIEGGLHGHAVAWLAVVPLCACILVGQRTCHFWCAMCLLVMGTFCALELCGIPMPILYPERWEATVTVAGYLTLAMFMSLVGISFEMSRRRALEKLHEALAALSAANQALSTANEQLHHLNQERSAFLSIAAHDLRNPLGAIVGFAQLLERIGPDNSTLHGDCLKRILTAGAQMRGLLDRLLSVQAIEEGKLALKSELCDLAALASRCVENQRIAATAKKIFLGFVGPSSPAWVMADSQAILQIVENLLSNAVKFSPPGQPVGVTVELDAAAKRFSVEVQDAGPGLSEEDQKKLYGRFAKLSARPTAGESSTGLGLSIVKRMAEAMGGQMGCRSKLGEGSTFIFTLPVAEDPAAKSSAVGAAAASSASAALAEKKPSRLSEPALQQVS